MRISIVFILIFVSQLSFAQPTKTFVARDSITHSLEERPVIIANADGELRISKKSVKEVDTTTTDGSQITVSTIPIDANVRAVSIISEAFGIDGAGNLYHARKEAMLKRASGTLSLIGSAENIVPILGQGVLTDATTSFTVTGDNVEVKSTGVVGTTVDWYFYIEIIRF